MARGLVDEMVREFDYWNADGTERITATGVKKAVTFALSRTYLKPEFAKFRNKKGEFHLPRRVTGLPLTLAVLPESAEMEGPSTAYRVFFYRGGGPADSIHRTSGSFKDVYFAKMLTPDGELKDMVALKAKVGEGWDAQMASDHVEELLREACVYRLFPELEPPDARVSFHSYLSRKKELPRALLFVQRGHSLLEDVGNAMLKEKAKEKKGIPEEQTQVFLDMAIQVASGLEAMHQKNYGHYDLKPENVLKFNSGPRTQYRLTDMGFVRTFSEPVDCGSFNYMDPQLMSIFYQAEDGAPLKQTQGGSAIDVFAFGSILFNIWYGTWTPYQLLPRLDEPIGEELRRGEVPDKVTAIWAQADPKQNQRHRSLEREMGRLLISMLEYERDLRPSMSKVLESLHEMQQRYRNKSPSGEAAKVEGLRV